MTDDSETMADLYRQHGYDPDELVHPRHVGPDDAEDATVVAYTTVRNPDPNGPATTWDVREYEVETVVPTEEVKEYTDGAVYFKGDTPVTHSVHWAYSNSVPKMEAINYGDEAYGPDSDFEDPYRWDRLTSHVHGLSDDFIRFDV